MHIISIDIQSFAFWLNTHLNWALWSTALISFAESLIIIGSIIPSSVLMTSIGIIVGRSALPTEMIFCAAAIGALIGDGLNYLFGMLFSNRLDEIWIFKKHKTWLISGRQHFLKYGSLSILIGRFTGPLRPVVPIIAGAMKMHYWRFFIPNLIACITWSIVYLLPGILIGMYAAGLKS